MTTMETVAMPDRVTGTVHAEDFPPELAAALSLRPVRGSSYLVTVVEIEQTDEEKLAALRTAVAKGRAEFAAGLGIDGETMFAELRAEFFPDSLKK
jgi:hypothetical protein